MTLLRTIMAFVLFFIGIAQAILSACALFTEVKPPSVSMLWLIASVVYLQLADWTASKYRIGGK